MIVLNRFVAIIACIVLLLLVAACDEDPEGDVVVEPTPLVPGVRAPEGEKRIEEIIIYRDRIEPRQINLTASAPAEIQVANRSGRDCTFFIGEYLVGLRVPAGETTKMSLTLPVDRSGAVVTMGCAGDEERQGSAVIEFKGLLPGPGR